MRVTSSSIRGRLAREPKAASAPRDLLRDPRRGLRVAALLLLGVAVLTVPVALDRSAPPLLDGIDRWWRDLALPPPSGLGSVSETLKLLGSGLVMVPLRVAVAAWLFVRRRYVDLAAWLLAWVAADLLTLLLKPAIGRVRPDFSHATSFPSAHAKTAAQAVVAPCSWR
jgi:hypothetical protein